MFRNVHDYHTSKSDSSSNRFSGWALDDDVENTVGQVHEAHDPGIPPIPPTPSKPARQPSSQWSPSANPVSFPLWSTESNIFPTSNWNSWSVPQTPPQPQPRPIVNTQPPQTPVQPVQPPQTPVQNSPLVNTQAREYVTSEPLFKRNYFDCELETRRVNHEDAGKLEYLTVYDIFEYVTLGRCISDSYIDDLSTYVTREVPTEYYLTKKETTFHGRVYEKEYPIYSWEQYGPVAKCCLDWAITNPEKLAR